jgi:hypothetical protein
MANVLNGNTWFADTVHSNDADDLVRKQTLVTYIIVTTTGANARIVLGDSSGNTATKLDLRVSESGVSKLFRFDGNPVLFPNGIRVLTLTNAVVRPTQL